MTVTGKVVEVFPPDRGAIVVAVMNEDGGKLLDLRCWGDTVRPQAGRVKVGDRVEAECSVDTRAVTTDAGKKYRFTNANVFSIRVVEPRSEKSSARLPSEDPNDEPNF